MAKSVNHVLGINPSLPVSPHVSRGTTASLLELKWEISLGRTHDAIICGVDEVGRGPLAGPVVACALILPATLTDPAWQHVQDSKKLSTKRRAQLASFLQERCTFALGVASVAEIDQLNILQASLLAMRRAVGGLPAPPNAALVDGNQSPRLPCPEKLLIGGDACCLSIAAASIVAKVTRDELMAALAQTYPDYGFDRHAGYGTAQHLVALRTLGPCPAHRRSFAPVAALLPKSDAA